MKDVQFRYYIAKGGMVSFKVYDVTGRLVRTLENNERKAGYHFVHFDGCDNKGRRLSSGIYFFRLSTEDFDDVKKAVYLK